MDIKVVLVPLDNLIVRAESMPAGDAFLSLLVLLAPPEPAVMYLLGDHIYDLPFSPARKSGAVPAQNSLSENMFSDFRLLFPVPASCRSARPHRFARHRIYSVSNTPAGTENHVRTGFGDFRTKCFSRAMRQLDT